MYYDNSIEGYELINIYLRKAFCAVTGNKIVFIHQLLTFILEFLTTFSRLSFTTQKVSPRSYAHPKLGIRSIIITSILVVRRWMVRVRIILCVDLRITGCTWIRWLWWIVVFYFV